MKTILLFVLLSSLLLSGCTTKKMASISDSECDEIMGEKTSFTGIQNYEFLSFKNGWNDNFPRPERHPILKDKVVCRKAEDKGENVNYIYCEGLVGKKFMNTTKEGDILSSYTRLYDIEVALDPEKGYQWPDKIPADVISISCTHVGDYCYDYPYCD